jgi:cytochrome c biogenesis protein CcmG/thiol:disulfide interchange protein DsbE
MRARHLGAPLAALLLAGCATGPGADSPAASPGSAETTAAGITGVPACEQLPATTAASGNEALPRLTLACLGPGPEVSLARLTGRPTLVNLWATWCGPCREEMPLLQDAFTRHGEQIRFLGVDVQDDPTGAAAFVADLGVGYPHVVDRDGRLLSALGVRGLPVTLAVDADGRVVARSVGQVDAGELQALIDQLLS